MIDSEACQKIFPFSFGLDKSLKLSFIGRSLEARIGVGLGVAVADCLQSIRPATPITTETISGLVGHPLVLQVVNTDLLLSGAFYNLEGSYFFIGSPKLESVSELLPLKLTIGDFAPHDLVINHLLQLQKMEVSAAETIEAAERLTEQQLIYRSIVDQSHDIIVAVNERGRVSHANPKALSALGQGIINQRGSRLLSRSSRAIWRRAAESIRGEAGSHWIELDLVGRSGTTLQVEGHLVRSMDVGSGTGLTGILRDVTQRKKTEAELRISNEKLQQARRLESLGRFAGGIAHDFNNLLGVISGVAELLQEDTDQEDPRQEDIDTILMTVKKGAALARQVFQFSQQQAPAKGRADMVAHTRGMDAILRQTVGNDVDLTVSLLAESAFVEIPSVQYEQILMNLVVNAVHAMPDGGGLLVEVGRDEGRDEAFIKVEDSGEGIEPDVLRRIFEPFFSTRSPGLGSGLGLSVVYGIIKGAGGEVHVDSEPGVGTNFRITLPLSAGCSEEGQAANPSGSWKQVGRPGVRVVLLEDQPDLRSLTLRALRQMGLEVQAFANLAEARSGFTEYEGVPDLFITDVALTDGNGLDLAEELDADGRLSKVIIVTGNADFDRVDKLTSTRGWQLLTKPYELRELNESVVSAVSP